MWCQIEIYERIKGTNFSFDSITKLCQKYYSAVIIIKSMKLDCYLRNLSPFMPVAFEEQLRLAILADKPCLMNLERIITEKDWKLDKEINKSLLKSNNYGQK